ncbi:MAG: ribulose-phosphate 3-epimerase [Spirochaetaceae bacterium]|nr:ribulose-phosphate 3-epimerase [Spirochaetaceae bacterium]
MNKVVAPSLLAANFANLLPSLQLCEEANLHSLHLDVMDGHFVPPISFGSQMVAALRIKSSLFFDVHLMTYRLEEHIEDFFMAGADSLSFHYEATSHHHRIIEQIKEFGLKVGVALNPSSPLTLLSDILPYLDKVLIMSVNPGYGGQKFIEHSLTKIKNLAFFRQELGLNFLIEVDGGVNLQNAAALYKAGADVLIAGNALFSDSTNFIKNAAKFQEIFND